MKTAILCLPFLLAALSSGNGQHEGHDHHRVNVDVYYESLCPDSIKFVTTQLYPTLVGNLSQFVNLTLVPYGRSTDNFVADQYEFKCKHGPKECEENKIHLCALKLVDGGKPTPGLGYNKIALGFINCLMRDTKNDGENSKIPTEKCATVSNINNLAAIENCANHVDASNYLSMAGKLTRALSPPLTSVPRIVFNGQYKDADDKLAQKNFAQAVCQYIDHDKPAECSKSAGFAPIASGAVLLLSVLVSLF